MVFWVFTAGVILGTYIHDLDPVIFQVWGKLALRWYGLSYLLAFVVGFFVLRSLSRRELWVVKEEKISDFLTYAAVFGVFLGGRLGHFFFYTIPEEGWGVWAADPLLPLKVWQGGMASHGGFLGLFFFTLYFAWRNKLSWPAVGDGLCVAAPLGLFLGRMANFINGELYGRPVVDAAWGEKWGVKFPGALWSNGNLSDALGSASLVSERAMELASLKELSLSQKFEPLLEISREEPAVLEAFDEYLVPRHCSQLYEGFLEGLLLFGVLYAVRVLWGKAPHGVITGGFFVLYAGFRIFVENFREPDSDLVFGEMMTKGQFYSVFMILIGLGFWVWAFLTRGQKVVATGR